MRAASAILMAASLAASDMRGECIEPAESILKRRDGRAICAVHRIPLISTTVFFESRDQPMWYHLKGEVRRVFACNPNGLYPETSLRRTKRYRFQGQQEYCPTCERAMAAVRARAEKYFERYGTYPP